MKDFELFNKYLRYEPESGKLYWKEKTSKFAPICVGDETDNKDNAGYLQVKLQGKSYKVHRVAWLLTYGEWPKGEINHIDHVRDNNRLSNLEDITHAYNMHHMKCHSNGALPGVCWYKRYNKWMAHGPNINGKEKFLGLFNTEEEAYVVSKAAFEANYFSPENLASLAEFEAWDEANKHQREATTAEELKKKVDAIRKERSKSLGTN